MATIYLSLGRSTVLNFDTPPKKIISGNANYFGIEFTGRDVTIQPLSEITSNLFVYTEKKRYGFIIKARPHKYYDDLVYVRWQYPKLRLKKKVVTYPSLVRNNRFKIDLKNVEYNQKRNLHLVDFFISNLSKITLQLTSNDIWVTRSNKILPVLEKVISKNSLSVGETLRLRLIIRLKQKRGFSTHFRIKNKVYKFIIPRRYL
jgi:hypothetical protein